MCAKNPRRHLDLRRRQQAFFRVGEYLLFWREYCVGTVHLIPSTEIGRLLIYHANQL
jgi:hypothetical protein